MYVQLFYNELFKLKPFVFYVGHAATVIIIIVGAASRTCATVTDSATEEVSTRETLSLITTDINFVVYFNYSNKLHNN